MLEQTARTYILAIGPDLKSPTFSYLDGLLIYMPICMTKIIEFEMITCKVVQSNCMPKWTLFNMTILLLITCW